VKTVGITHNVVQKYSIATQISILKRSKHPHIIKLLDAFEYNNHYYIVTELAPKGDLWTYLNTQGKMSEWSTAWIAKQILLALNYMHSALHLVHWLVT
jgi:serine/threonine protein kinase